NTIEQAVRDGVETVGRIKRFARRDAERKLEKVDLRAAIREVLEIVRPRWAQSHLKGAPVVVQQELGAVPPVMARGAELREVLINLVLNAGDAMPTGGILTLRKPTEGGLATGEGADSGQRMP